jgi:hypothetical protein
MTVDTSVAPLLAARTALATALEAATGWDVYVGASSNLATPAVVIEPNGWALSGAHSRTVAYTVNVTCLYNASEGSIEGAEEMARAVYVALASLGWLVPEVPPVASITYAERPFVGVQFTAGTTLTL